MSFVAKIFGGGGSGSGTPGNGLPIGGPGNQGKGTGTGYTSGTIGKPKTALPPSLSAARGKTKTNYTGPLGLSSQADTARKTLLGQ